MSSDGVQPQTEAVAAQEATLAPAAPPAPAVEKPSEVTENPPGWEKGVCPVKPEFLRQQPVRISTDPEQRSRGMTPGGEREFVRVEGTSKPTFEGEINFLWGQTMQDVKAAIRIDVKRRRYEEEHGRDAVKTAKKEDDAPKTCAASEATPTATADAPAPATTTVDTPTDTAQAPVPAPVEAVGPPAKPAETPAAPTTAAAEAPALTAVITPPTAAETKAKRDTMFRDKLVLSPLTTVGNLPYRRVCKGFGVDITVSEMSLAKNLNTLQKSEWSLLRRHECEDVFGIQVACSRGWEATTVAKAIAASGFTYDFIDVNCGCPIDQMVNRGLGCGLGEKRGRMRDVVKSLCLHQPKPVTVKVRVGVSETDPTLHKNIQDFSEWGASAVTIHGRSRRQRYTKLANWDYIGKCADLTPLPVIGNGDLMSLQDYRVRREAYPNVSSVMIGRGALVKPWVFTEIKEERVDWDISSTERFDMIKKFCDYGLSHWGSDRKGVQTTRRFLCEWLSFLCRYVPIGVLDQTPQKINERPPFYVGRNDLETLMASDSVEDWIRLSEMILGPAGDDFKFTPKHKSNSYSSLLSTSTVEGAMPEG